MNIDVLINKYPIIEAMSTGEEIVWLNPNLKKFDEIKDKINQFDVEDARRRLDRFSPFIKHCFSDTIVTNGVIESPLVEIPKMHEWLNSQKDANLKGRLMLKQDSHLAVAGSVKARGGIYEILTYAEKLAIKHGKINEQDNYIRFADPDMREFFSEYNIHVGSTGNLGLSIGIISTALGFTVNVHMSSDAKQWKKDLLTARGANVIEYDGDYEKAVRSGQASAAKDKKSYFVDDENSVNLFLGYAVAGKRLESQLIEKHITIDKENPLFVYIPCGVGGAPGGITYGLKLIFGDNVHIFYVEPTEACCMGLGLITKLHDEISVQDIGLSGKTEADGLAVARPSKLVGKIVEELIEGEFTVKDDRLYLYMKALCDTENIFIEPSSCATFCAPEKLNKDKTSSGYIQKCFSPQQQNNAIHIVWATGGSLVPENVRTDYYDKALKMSKTL